MRLRSFLGALAIWYGAFLVIEILAATTLATADVYDVPGDPSYAVTPFDTNLFRDESEARAAGFHHWSP
ncbi:hypothetical protein MF672_038095 [Actinomadura sp. ATCC 31491]|uniref:Uncharacterized protein n=1 Tax=Actinomadura luzonensis TaxID=2805427 RepID=A0ABT0G4R4_9ACTN|nr:hypothetical protein [Actinomadura luzonensis]MCK2219565.1 hypothetical protein [Actinomadura luzonensis]